MALITWAHDPRGTFDVGPQSTWHLYSWSDPRGTCDVGSWSSWHFWRPLYLYKKIGTKRGITVLEYSYKDLFKSKIQ